MFVACELGLVREELQQLIRQSWSQGSLNFSAPASKEIPEKGRLGPTLSPIPFPLTLQLSTRPLCALHVKEKPEVLSCSNPTPQVALPLAQLEEHLLSLIQNWDPPSMLILCS